MEEVHLPWVSIPNDSLCMGNHLVAIKYKDACISSVALFGYIVHQHELVKILISVCVRQRKREKARQFLFSRQFFQYRSCQFFDFNVPGTFWLDMQFKKGYRILLPINERENAHNNCMVHSRLTKRWRCYASGGGKAKNHKCHLASSTTGVPVSVSVLKNMGELFKILCI